MRRAILFAAANLSVLAMAGDADIRNPPPAQYAHLPTMPLIMSEDISTCPPVPGLVACAGVWQGVGYVFIRAGLTTLQHSQALLHEYAHLNGWPANHPR